MDELVWDQGVEGSNPFSPTIWLNINYGIFDIKNFLFSSKINFF